jgi:SAM-dependent methyltransferase
MIKDYKSIWDNLSCNFKEAAFYVCCIDDEDQIRSNGAATSEFLRSVLQITPEDKVLEIGCGIARIGRELAPQCGEWHGADISGNMIEYARRRTQGIPNVYLHELPGSSLRIFGDNTFDCVYSSIVFMHIDKIDMFNYIREAYRVLKWGGRAYFDTYNLLAPEAWREFMKLVEAFSSGERPGHMSQFSTPQELRKFMDEAGFADVGVDDQNPQLVVALGKK